MKQDIHDQALQALIESIMNHSAAIVLRETQLASGVILRFKNQIFIATAGHVLEKTSEDDLRFIFRPRGTLQHVHDSKDIRQMVARKFTPLAIKGIAVSSEEDDLVLLSVSDDVVQDHGVQSYDFKKVLRSPATGDQVLVVGFPFEHSLSAIDQFGEQGIGVLATGYVTEVAPEDRVVHKKFSPEAHYLLAFTGSKDEASLEDPHGMSGAGVWKPPPIVPTELIWSPTRLELVGIQVSWFERSKVLKVVRVERLAALLSEAVGA
jgi:hypothetical protein